MSLPEDVAAQLGSKVTRINVLQKLVLQERINLKAKTLGADGQGEEIAEINEEIRAFLMQLLARELGGNEDEAPDPFAQIGIHMTSDKVDALNALLERIVSTTSVTHPADNPPATVPPTSASPATPPPAPRVSPTGHRILSPVLQALKEKGVTEDEFAKLSPEERARKIKEIEREARVVYK